MSLTRASYLLIFLTPCQGWLHSSCDGCFVNAVDPLQTSESVYLLQASAEVTSVFVSVVQPKKRADTKSQYWYGDPGLVVLKRSKSNASDWSSAACLLTGVTRTNDCELVMDPSMQYCCLPFSCLAAKRGHGSAGYHFRIATYSSASVDIQRVRNSAHFRQAGTRVVHQTMMSNETKLIYPVSHQGAIICVHGEGCLFFLALNGSDDEYLSIKLSFELKDGIILAFGENDGTHDVAPGRERLLAVLVRSGKVSTTTGLNFRYLSASIPAKRASTANSTATGLDRLGSSVELTVLADMLARSIDPCRVCVRGGDTIDTYLWIPQLGAT